MNNEMIERLKKLALSECYHDDEDDDKFIDSYVGGNVDDAFDLGERAGEVMLARDVLSALNIEWVEEWHPIKTP